MVPVVLV